MIKQYDRQICRARLSQDGHGNRRYFVPFKPRQATRFKVEGGGDAVLLGPLQVVQSTLKNAVLRALQQGTSRPRRGEVMVHMTMPRAARARSRSSFHPAPILVRLPGPLACCHAFLVFGPCLGSSPETEARHPVGVPGAVLNGG